MLAVSFGSECRRTRCTVARGTPALRSSVAVVWRRSLKVTCRERGLE